MGRAITGAAWIYLRDWERPRPLPHARQATQVAAAEALRSLAGAERCRACRLVVHPDGERTWRVEIDRRQHPHCFTVDLSKFEVDPETGLRGIRNAPCQR